MKRELLSLMLVSLVGTTSVLADEWDSTSYPGHDWQDSQDYERGRIERRVDPSTGDLIISARLHHQSMGQQVLDLERILALETSSVRGRRLEKVAIEARSRNYLGVAQLLVNGRTTGEAKRIDQDLDREVFVIHGRDIMGMDIHRLELLLRGDVILQKVAVRLSRGQSGGGGWDNDHDGRERTIHRIVSQEVYGSELLKLRQILDLGSEDRGLDVERVTIMGNSRDAYRALRVTLLINGQRVGASKLLQRGSVSFVIPEHRDDIGSDIRKLQVLVEGRGYIHAVSAVVEREYGEHDDFDTWISSI